MKRFIIFLFALIICSHYAQTEDNFYARGLSGMNWIGRLPIGNKAVSYTTKPGYFGSVALGYRMDSCFRFEAEYFYQKNRVKTVAANFTIPASQELGIPAMKLELPDLKVNGHHITHAYMINALVDWQLDFYVVPYVGLGFGYAESKMKIEHTFANKGAVAQLILGAKYPLTNTFDIFSEYRFFIGKEHLTNNILALGIGLNF